MDSIILNVLLTVERVDQVLKAHLVFANNTSEKILLDKYTVCLDGKFRNNVFEITNSKGKEVNYYGIMMKRLLSEDDYIVFEPGGVLKVTVALNDAYRIEFGQKYSIKYYAFNPGLNERFPLMEMISNTVTIHYI